MKSIPYAIFLLICLMACQDEINLPDGYDHPCDEMLGRFELLPSSLAKIPYEGKQSVVFVDSLGNELTLVITTPTNEDDKQALIFNWPDMTKEYFCYESQPIDYALRSNDLSIQINARYMAKLHTYDALVADEARILMVLTGNPHYLESLALVLDPRSFGEDDYNTHLDTFSCFGKNFLDVEHNSIIFGPPQIFYNDSEGVVSIIDTTGRRWCFDRFN